MDYKPSIYRWKTYLKGGTTNLFMSDRPLTPDKMSLFDNSSDLLAVNFVLNNWSEKGVELLINDLPRMLNEHSTTQELFVTEDSTHGLFPSFTQMLRETREVAFVSFLADNKIRNIFVGLHEPLPDNFDALEVEFHWAYYLPVRLGEIKEWEENSNINLSSQMKHLYLRANGTPYLLSPYFYSLDDLIKGTLAETYRPIWNLINSSEPFSKLEEFVSISESGTGDEYGFFPSFWRSGKEYAIYRWDHGVAGFERYWDNFADMLDYLLT